uniref:BRO1 domain-containing protein n=1 Tax=Ascaris lumbricoides TaxID=6252 RepID=A0A0M3ID41_ASCLU
LQYKCLFGWFDFGRTKILTLFSFQYCQLSSIVSPLVNVYKIACEESWIFASTNFDLQALAFNRCFDIALEAAQRCTVMQATRQNTRTPGDMISIGSQSFAEVISEFRPTNGTEFCMKFLNKSLDLSGGITANPPPAWQGK